MPLYVTASADPTVIVTSANEWGNLGNATIGTYSVPSPVSRRWPALLLPDAVKAFIGYTTKLPASWATFDLIATFISGQGSSGVGYVQGSFSQFNDGDNPDAAETAGTLLATTFGSNVLKQVTLASGLTNNTAKEFSHFAVYREGDNAGDTMTVSLNFLRAKFVKVS